MFQEKCYLRVFQLICDVTDDVIQIKRQIVKSGERRHNSLFLTVQIFSVAIFCLFGIF